MTQALISAEQLSRSLRAEGGSRSALTQTASFSDLPLPARLLLAVPRVRGPLPKASIAER